MEFEKYYSPDGKDFRGYLIKHNGKYLSTDWEFTVDLDKTHACRITPEMLGGRFEAGVMPMLTEVEVRSGWEGWLNNSFEIHKQDFNKQLRKITKRQAVPESARQCLINYYTELLGITKHYLNASKHSA